MSKPSFLKNSIVLKDCFSSGHFREAPLSHFWRRAGGEVLNQQSVSQSTIHAQTSIGESPLSHLWRGAGGEVLNQQSVS